MRIQAIAWHELRHLRRMVSWRSIAPLIAAALILGALAPVAFEAGVDPDAGLYPVAVEDGHPLAQAVANDTRLRMLPAEAWTNDPADASLLLTGERILVHPDDARAQAALQVLKQATARWLEDRLALEPDQAAAFPVRIDIGTTSRDLVTPALPAPGPGPAPESTPGTADPRPAANPTATRDVMQQADIEPRQGLRPTQLEPPFPMGSILLTFAFLIPMNFVAQMQAGALHSDRVRRKAMILLSAPLPAWQILAGRVLPYAILAAFVWLGATLFTGTDAWGAAAGLVIVAFVLAASILVGLLARSEREVTFLLTGITTGFSTFLFLPAVFVALPPIAYLSPVSVVAAGIRGDTVSAGAFAYATLPITFMAVTMAALCVGLYREETLFAPLALWKKASQGLARIVRSRWLAFAAAVAIVPWAFTAELFVVALVVPLGAAFALPLLVVGAGFIEEAWKAWIATQHRRSRQGEGRPVSAWVTGILVGLGFYKGERIAFVLVLVQFDALETGPTTLTLFGIGSAWVALLPLGVHIVSAIISASGALGTRVQRRLAWLAAATLHAAYNVAMVVRAGA